MRPTALLALTLAAGCAEPDLVGSIALRLEEAALLDEVDEIVLDVHDAEGLSCRENGELVGTPTADPIVRDLRLTIGEENTVTVSEGERVFVVTGTAAGERIAVGCSAERLRGGQTVEIEILVHRLVNPGLCGNADLEESEQCDDGNLDPGDGCDETCATEEGTLPQSAVAAQLDPSASAGSGGFFAVTWFDANQDAGAFVKVAFRDENGLRQDGGLGNDRDVNDQVRGDPNVPSIATGPAGTVLTWEDFSGTGADLPDVKAHFYGPDTRELTGTDVAAHATVTGRQDQPSAAIRSTGVGLVVWRDDQLSPTGIAGRLFVGGQPDGDALDVSGGQESSSPKATATADGFAVAFVGAGIRVRMVDEDGTVGAEIATGAAASATTPAIGATADGATVLVAWIEQGGVRAQRLEAGAVVGEPFTVSTEGTNALPVVAGGPGRFAVGWQAGGDVFARLLDEEGEPLFNRVDDDATPFQLNRSTDGTQQHPGLAMLGDLLLAVWQDGGNRPEDAEPTGVRYRWLAVAPAR